MEELLNCNFCENSATIHLIQVINNQVNKIYLCENCAKTKGVTEFESFSFSNLFNRSLEKEIFTRNELHACPKCGFSEKDCKKNGRLGCANCYQVYQAIILPLLNTIQKGNLHKGKIPKKIFKHTSIIQKIKNLEKKLSKAIECENFELAAQLRDQIKVLIKKSETAITQ